MRDNNAALAQELAEWKARVHEAWNGVSIHMDGCVSDRCHWDESVELKVSVALNGLAPDDVRVECLVEPECTGTHTGPGPDAFVLEASGEKDGKTLFKTRIQPPYPGLQTLRLRIYPHHKALTHPLEMGAMLWA